MPNMKSHLSRTSMRCGKTKPFRVFSFCKPCSTLPQLDSPCKPVYVVQGMRTFMHCIRQYCRRSPTQVHLTTVCKCGSILNSDERLSTHLARSRESLISEYVDSDFAAAKSSCNFRGVGSYTVNGVGELRSSCP